MFTLLTILLLFLFVQNVQEWLQSTGLFLHLCSEMEKENGIEVFQFYC